MNSPVGCLTFPFFTMSWYLVLVLLGSNMIKKGYDWIPWLFMFLRTPLSSSCDPSKAPFKRVRHGLQCISHPWHIWHRCVVWNMSIEFWWTHCALSFSETRREICMTEAMKAMWMEWQVIVDTCMYFFCSCASPVVPLNFTYKTHAQN